MKAAVKAATPPAARDLITVCLESLGADVALAP